MDGHAEAWRRRNIKEFGEEGVTSLGLEFECLKSSKE